MKTDCCAKCLVINAGIKCCADPACPFCHAATPNTFIEKMLAEFDERFSADWAYGFGTTTDIYNRGLDAIKAFITRALTEQAETLRGEVEALIETRG